MKKNKKFLKDDLKVSIDLFNRIISVPSSPNLIKD